MGAKRSNEASPRCDGAAAVGVEEKVGEGSQSEKRLASNIGAGVQTRGMLSEVCNSSKAGTNVDDANSVAQRRSQDRLHSAQSSASAHEQR